jgi:hypothetical protein
LPFPPASCLALISAFCFSRCFGNRSGIYKHLAKGRVKRKILYCCIILSPQVVS